MCLLQHKEGGTAERFLGPSDPAWRNGVKLLASTPQPSLEEYDGGFDHDHCASGELLTASPLSK